MANNPRGRPKGSLNKATAEVKQAAQQYTEEALLTLSEIMRSGANEQARISAANSLLDRGHGKPSQAIAGDPDQPLKLEVSWSA